MLELLGKSVEGLEFTILFGYIRAFVFDELSCDTDDDVIIKDEFGFQHIVTVLNRNNITVFVFMFECEAMRAVGFIEREQKGTVNDDLPIFVVDSAVLKGAHTNKAGDKPWNNVLQLYEVKAFKEVINSTPVRQFAKINAKHAHDIFYTGVIVEFLGQLPHTSDVKNDRQNSDEENNNTVIYNVTLVSGISDTA